MAPAFTPGDEVVVKRTGGTGVVTYPGPNSAFPGRVHVRLNAASQRRSVTVHYHADELDLAR